MSEPIVNYNFSFDPSANIDQSRIENREGLAEHLGGHENETHNDEGALDYLIKEFDIKSMIDIGCGPGGMIDVALNRGLEVVGVDGDHNVPRSEQANAVVTIHDYEKGPWVPAGDKIYDLGWSVEFVEHIWAKHMPNFIETFKRCKYVLMTHGLPGQPGHHHVNCQVFEYWLGVMEYNGFEIMVDGTNEVRKASTMRERYIRQQGYLFKNGRV